MIQLGIIIGYLALLLVLGLFASRMFRGTSKDYMLASHSIGPFLLLMSLFGTTMTAFALVGSTGKAYKLGVVVYGMLASASGIVHSLCFFLVGLKLWAIGRKHGYTTQLQFFRERLENNSIGLLLFPVVVGLVIPYLLIGVLGSGFVVNGVTHGTFKTQGWFESYHHGVPPWLASLVICLVVLTYVFFGGMRGTAWANAMQTAIFMILGIVTFITIANGLGGKESLLENMQAATQAVVTPDASADPETQQAQTAAGMHKISISGRMAPSYFSFLLIPLSVAMFPHVFQHWLTARSAKAFRLPIIAHPIMILIVWLPCVMIGVWATAPTALGPDAKENLVLAMMVQRLAGPVLAGLLTAGILAAIMSSLDSQFLCLGTMFTNDVVLHYGDRDRFSDKQIVWMARCFVAVIVAATYGISLLSPRSIFDTAIWCFSGFVGLFPLVFASIYWRKLTAAGAWASVTTTVVIWNAMFYQWCQLPAKSPPYSFPGSPWPSAEFVLIPPLMPVVTIFVASSIVLVVVSLLTKPPSEATLTRFFGKS